MQDGDGMRFLMQETERSAMGQPSQVGRSPSGVPVEWLVGAFVVVFFVSLLKRRK